MTLGTTTAKLVRTWRRTIFLMVPSMLLWVPCLALSIVFFLNDELYQLAIFAPESNTSLMEDYRRAARELEGEESFACKTRRHDEPGEADEREPLLRSIELAESSSSIRLLHVGGHKWAFVLRPVERLDLAVLRRGTNVDREQIKGHQTFQRFNTKVIEPFCEEQEARAAEGLPPLPPIPVYAQARALLLDAADKMDATLARYAEVRPWLLAFFYTWIAYSLFGFVCAFQVLRLTKRIKERLAQGSTAEAEAVP